MFGEKALQHDYRATISTGEGRRQSTSLRTDGDYSTEIRLSQDDANLQMQRTAEFLEMTKQYFKFS